MVNAIKLLLIAMCVSAGLYLLGGIGGMHGIRIFQDTFFTPVGMMITAGYAWITTIVIKL